MIGKKPAEHQMSIFDVALESIIDMKQVMIDSTVQEKNITFPGSGLIVSALALQGNPYDGHTLSAHREQIARLTGYEPVEALTEKARKKFCKRAGIEPVIGHLKSDHRMMRNHLKGTLGDAINTMMAAAAYNMRHWMNKNALSSFVSWLLTLVRRLENVLFENENQYAWKDSTLATVAK